MNEQEVPKLLGQVAKSWMTQKSSKATRSVAQIVVWGAAKDTAALKKHLPIPPWQWNDLVKSGKSTLALTGKQGPVWLVRPRLLGAEDPKGGHLGLLALSEFTKGRDTVGAAVAQALEAGLENVRIDFYQVSDDLLQGALVGLEIAGYQFRRVGQGQYPPKQGLIVRVEGKSVDAERVARATALAQAVNLARHLTNLPPNALHPASYAKAVQQLFSRRKRVKVEIWGPDRLKKEGMSLMLAVGQGAPEGPRLVKISYRPTKAKKGERPLAFVGKGITFDTGGVNLKPDSAMRLMKKDMGGSACVVGLAHWVSLVELDRACDFYLALAENSIDGKSFRPSDVLQARSGKTVEIHNTDAEGRLVLADAMDVAIEEKPQLMVDVATLTGAIKAGLGSAIGGLFGNDDRQVERLARAAQQAGDWLWPMPLHRKYKTALRSTAAEMVNAGDGFGGAITAALFLEAFSGEVPWLHLDIYAWKDSADGALSESGGSGQAVQALAKWLQDFEADPKHDRQA